MIQKIFKIFTLLSCTVLIAATHDDDPIYTGFNEFFSENPDQKIEVPIVNVGQILIPAKIAGKTVYFMLDNGAHWGLIFGYGKTAAKKSEKQRANPWGYEDYEVEVELGGHRFNWNFFYLEVFDAPGMGMRNSFPDIEYVGIIGSDQMRQATVELDYLKRGVRFLNPADAEFPPEAAAALSRGEHYAVSDDHVYLHYEEDVEDGQPAGRIFVPHSTVKRPIEGISSEGRKLRDDHAENLAAMGEAVAKIERKRAFNPRRRSFIGHRWSSMLLTRAPERIRRILKLSETDMQEMDAEMLAERILRADEAALRSIYYETVGADFLDTVELADAGGDAYQGFLLVDLGLPMFALDGLAEIVDGTYGDDYQPIESFSLGPMRWSGPVHSLRRNYREMHRDFPTLIGEVGNQQLLGTKTTFYFDRNVLEVERDPDFLAPAPVRPTGMRLTNNMPPKVRNIKPWSFAAALGLKKGDEIVAINGQEVSGIAGFLDQYYRGQVGERLEIVVNRPGESDLVVLTGEYQTTEWPEEKP